MRKKYRVSIQSVNGEHYYACPYCFWLMFSETYADNHMEKCVARPEAYSCATCGNRVEYSHDEWICGEDLVEGELFGPDGNATSYCNMWCDGDWGEDDYYGRVLKVGDEFTPRGFNKSYKIEEVLED